MRTAKRKENKGGEMGKGSVSEFYGKRERLSKGGVWMKGRRKISLIVAAALAIGVVGYGNVSKAASGVENNPIVLEDNGATVSCDKGLVPISYQYLPNDGLTTTAKDVQTYDNDSIAQKMLTDLYSDNATTLKMTFALKNASFAADKLALVIDNGSTSAPYCFAAVPTGNKVAFGLDNATVSMNSNVKLGNILDGANHVKWYLVDASSCNANGQLDSALEQITFKVSGSLNPGDRVELSLTSEENGKTFNNGCVRKDIYVVENQWIAHKCTCTNGDETGGIDTDKLIAGESGNITVEDTKLAESGISIYDACMSEASTGSTCCPGEEGSCGLFCQTSSTTENCAMPGICDFTTLHKGLLIFTNKDFAGDNATYTVTNLNDATVTFTLKGKHLNNIEKIELISEDSADKYAKATVLGTFTIDNDTTATATVSGSTLFTTANKEGTDGPIKFSVRITPKADANLLPDSFSLSATISGGTYLEHPETLNWGVFEQWAYDTESTYVFKVPYIRQDSQVTSVIRFENAGTDPVELSLYVNSPNGEGWQFVKRITVDPGKAGTVCSADTTTCNVVTGATLIQWAKDAGIDLDGSAGFAVRGVGNVDQNTFTVYASQEDTSIGSFRPLPVKILGADYQE